MKDVFWNRNPEWELNDDIHVWRIKSDLFYPELNTLFPKSETRQLERYVKQEDKSRFYISKSVSRFLLGKYLACNAEDLVIGKENNGKPYLTSHNSLHFNISHSGDWIVIAFANQELGVDIERIKEDFDFEILLPACFSDTEISHIRKAANPRAEFYRMWTLKESFLKGIGTGLVENLPEVDCLGTSVTFRPNLKLEAKTWYNSGFFLEEGYCGSLSFQTQSASLKFFEYQ